jgi:tetratricopeptide (TPR) repeat protein
MKQRNGNGNGNTDLRILGKFLWKMGKLDLAETYFKRLLNEISSDDSLLCDLYEDLGELTSQIGDFDMSIEWHKKALQLKEQNKLLDEFNNQENIIDSNGKIIRCFILKLI